MSQNNICKVNSLQSSDLICTKFVYETTDARAQEDTEREHLLGIAVEGGGTLHGARTALPLSRGSIFWIHRNTPFRITRENGLTYFYLCFRGRRAEELIARMESEEALCVLKQMTDCDFLLQFGFACLDKAKDESLDLFGDAMLLFTIGHLTQANHAPDTLLSRMITETNNRFSDASFSLSTLSQALGYDPKYLSFYFKRKKSVCYSEYLRDLRIRHAVFLMEQGVASVKNVALLSGFRDPLYFSKLFTKIMGCSPKAYMERLEP